MRPACVCPSIFDFPHTGDTPSLSAISIFLEKWFAALKRHHFLIVFSPNYVGHLRNNWLPTVKSEEVSAFKTNPCWFLMVNAASRYSFSAQKKCKSICCCSFANHFWTQQLTDLQAESPVIVSDSCSTRPTGFDTVCSESELKKCPPEIWLKWFRKNEWQTLPLAGDVFYEPPKDWKRTGIHPTTDKDITGYPDQKGRLWVFDAKEKHWDVFTSNECKYDRISPEGKSLGKHIRR